MSKILKDAMIDAKAVRATALANARAALEEAFSPKLEAMFSQKLKEMDQEGQQEPESIDSIDALQPEDQNIGGEEIPTDFNNAQDSAGINPVADITSGNEIDQATQALAESDDSFALDSSKSGEKTTDSVGVNGQTKQALKKDDKNVTANFSGSAQKVPAKSASGEKTTDSVGVNGQTKQALKKDDKNVTAPLKENECEDGESEKTELEEILSELEDGSKEDEDGKDLDESENPFAKKEDGDEEIDLDEVLSSLKEESEEEEKEEESDEEKDELKEQNASLVKENTDYKRALSYLKTKLNEINLLNAKLLYTNKLFKAADLSNNQKVKIVENMDLAKTVREVKYAYAIIAESINFGGKQPIKESAAPKKVVVQNKVVSTITEGLASRTVASTKPSKELLTEGAVMSNRFQKLAGIKTRKA
jgi:hypothetical protein